MRQIIYNNLEFEGINNFIGGSVANSWKNHGGIGLSDLVSHVDLSRT